jgi:leucyl aminopeptidase
MKAVVTGAAWVLGLGIWAGAAAAQPVEIVSAASKAGPMKPDRILFEDQGEYVVRTSEAKADDFADLFVVNALGWHQLPADIADYGDVVAFSPNKFAVMRLRADKVEDLSAKLHHDGLACGVLAKLTGEPMSLVRAATPTPLLPVAVRDARVERALSGITADNIRATIEELAAIYTRHHQTATGRGVAALLADKYNALKGDRADVTVETYDHGSATGQPSLRVRIQGATRPDEVIILGSHLDSINGSDPTGGRAPGADDNASGTATNMEIFRVLMEQGFQPQRTIEIHAYAAEEAGLVGSNNMANRYKADHVNVVAMVQHDMDLYKPAGTEDKIWFVTNNADAGFNDLLGQLSDGYIGIARGAQYLFGGSSDHASWYRAGYATAFPFENPSSYNRKIHTANDTIENSGAFTQAAAFAKLGAAYLMHFGGVN